MNALTISSQCPEVGVGSGSLPVYVGVEPLIDAPLVCLRQLEEVPQPQPNPLGGLLVWGGHTGKLLQKTQGGHMR